MYKIIVRDKGTACDHDAVEVHNPSYMLSIQDFGDEPVSTPKFIKPENHMHIFFDDLDIADAGKRISARYSDKIRARCPTRFDVQSILDFGKRIPDGSTLFMHCFAGIARSTASAYALYAQQLKAGEEWLAFKEMVKGSIAPWPNDLIVQIADDLLGRNGQLFKTFDDWRERKRIYWKLAGISSLD